MRTIRLIPLLFLFVSCFDNSDCLVTATTEVKIRFKNEDKSNRSILFSSIEVSGLSSPFYEGQQVSLVSLPVDPSANETTFTFHYDGISKEMTINYDHEIRIVSESCGAHQFQKNLSVAETDFSTVTLVNTRLLTDVSVNLEAYP